MVIFREHRRQCFISVLFHMCEPLYFSTCEKLWNNSETQKQFVSEFYFSFISHVWAPEIKLHFSFISWCASHLSRKTCFQTFSSNITGASGLSFSLPIELAYRLIWSIKSSVRLIINQLINRHLSRLID